MARSTDIDVTFRTRPGDQRIDTAAVNQVTHGPGVRKDLRRRARNVQAAAKAQVGVKSGRLRGTIRIEEGGNLRGVAASVTVVAGRPGMRYTGWHHDGTRAHDIYPTRKQALKFTGGGGVVFARRVRHPGTKANRFLTDSTRYWRP